MKKGINRGGVTYFHPFSQERVIVYFQCTEFTLTQFKLITSKGEKETKAINFSCTANNYSNETRLTK